VVLAFVELELVLFVLVVVVDVFMLLLDEDVFVLVLLALVVEEEELRPAGPLTLLIPVFCSVVGKSGWISLTQTPVYIPGLPSLARLPGSSDPQVP